MEVMELPPSSLVRENITSYSSNRLTSSDSYSEVAACLISAGKSGMVVAPPFEHLNLVLLWRQRQLLGHCALPSTTNSPSSANNSSSTAIFDRMVVVRYS